MAGVATPTVQSQDAIREDLKGIWSRVLNADSIPDEASFVELGGTSLDALRIVVAIQKRFDIDLSLVDFFENADLSALVRAVASRMSSDVETGDAGAAAT